MKNGLVRAIAIGIFRKGDEILVGENRDRVHDRLYYRPPGGGIEFQETGRQALKRELIEELGVAVAGLRFLGVLENIFKFEGKPRHEVILVFEGRLVDPAVYEQKELRRLDKKDRRAVWKPIADFRTGKAPLYPEGLLKLIDRPAPPAKPAGGK